MRETHFYLYLTLVKSLNFPPKRILGKTKNIRESAISRENKRNFHPHHAHTPSEVEARMKEMKEPICMLRVSTQRKKENIEVKEMLSVYDRLGK